MTKPAANGAKIMQTCGLCGASFQFGPHVYDGKYITRYQLAVCHGCWRSNHDGWSPSLEAKFIAHLKAKGVPLPERNAKGWFPRD
jgi:hypothetical protein